MSRTAISCTKFHFRNYTRNYKEAGAALVRTISSSMVAYFRNEGYCCFCFYCFLLFTKAAYFLDRTPPQVIISSKPATLSNQALFTFSFYCRDTCSFECTATLQGNNPTYSQCNRERYTIKSLQNGQTYVFSVRGTDDVGNQGNPVTYTWKVGERSLFV